MADTTTTTDIVSQVGPYAGSIVAAILAALGIKADHAKRIATLEERLDKLTREHEELEDKLDDRIKELARESMSPEEIRSVMVEATRPCMDKVMDLRERIADLSGVVKSLGG